MAIQIKLKNSVVQDSTPSTSDLPEVGELAVNANINSIGGFMRASDNSIVKIFGPGSLSTPTATTTVSGISELATNSETTTGTATNRVVTPAGLNAVTVAERTTSNNNYVAKAGSTLTGVLTMPNGSNSAPAINFGDSGSGIFGGTTTVSLAAGGITRLTADTGVSVVGTLAVTGSITSTSNLTIGDKIIHAGDTNTAIRFPAADSVSIETGGSEALRVDSSQRLLVGTSSARTNFKDFAGNTVTPPILFETANDDTAKDFALVYGRNNTNSANFLLGKHRTSTVGGNTIVQSGDSLGTVGFLGSDGTTFRIAASVTSFCDGTPGTDDMPGRLVFSTTADGASSPTTRLTIDSAGLATFAGNLSVGGDSVFTGDVTFDGATAGRDIVFDRSANALTFADSAVASFGASADFRIFHNGSDSILQDQGTGSLIALSNTFHIKNAANNETLAKFIEDGAAELYYNNVKKLETTSTGIAISGGFTTSDSSAFNSIASFNDDVSFFGASHHVFFDRSESAFEFQDSAKATFGTGNDLQIFHDGTDNLLSTVGTVLAVHRATSNAGNSVFEVRSNHGATNQVKFKVDGDGDVLIPTDTGKLQLGVGQDLQIYHDGTDSIISNSTGDLQITDTSDDITITAADDIRLRPQGGEDGINVLGNGNVQLFHDNVQKFRTYAAGVEVTGNIILPLDGSTTANAIQLGVSQDLRIYHDGSNSRIHDSGTGILAISGSQIDFQSANQSETLLQAVENGAVKLRHDNNLKFETTSNGAKCTGILESINQGNILNQTHSALILKSGTNDAMRANFLLQDDFPSGGGSLAINVTEAGVSNDRSLLLNRSGGFVGVRCTPTVPFEVSGASKFLNDVAHVDNAKAQFGNGDDLAIYHNGTDSIIGNTTGTLQMLSPVQMRFRASNFQFISYGNDETMASFVDDGSVSLFFNDSKKLETFANGIITQHVQPDNDNDHDIGSSAKRFDNIHATNGTIQTSDKNEKENILTSDLGLDFINKLKPISFKFKNKTRTHYGLIAQDIETVITDLGKTTTQFAPLIKETIQDGTERYGLRYTELIAPLIKAVQDLSAKVAALEGA